MVKFFKRVVILCGKRTSVRLSEIEWQTLEHISRHKNMRRNFLIEQIKNHKAQKMGLAPAIRLFMLIYFFNIMQKTGLLYNSEATDLSSLLYSLK